MKEHELIKLSVLYGSINKQEIRDGVLRNEMPEKKKFRFLNLKKIALVSACALLVVIFVASPLLKTNKLNNYVPVVTSSSDGSIDAVSLQADISKPDRKIVTGEPDNKSLWMAGAGKIVLTGYLKQALDDPENQDALFSVYFQEYPCGEFYREIDKIFKEKTSGCYEIINYYERLRKWDITDAKYDASGAKWDAEADKDIQEPTQEDIAKAKQDAENASLRVQEAWEERNKSIDEHFNEFLKSQNIDVEEGYYPTDENHPLLLSKDTILNMQASPDFGIKVQLTGKLDPCL